MYARHALQRTMPAGPMLTHGTSYSVLSGRHVAPKGSRDFFCRSAELATTPCVSTMKASGHCSAASGAANTVWLVGELRCTCGVLAAGDDGLSVPAG